MKFRAEVIDTWNMTITPVSRVFEISRLNRYEFRDKDGARIPLPARPGMALRVQR
jgi:hypothetical protein